MSEDRNFYSQNIQEIINKFNINTQTGLLTKNIDNLIEKHGYNTLPEKPKVSFMTKFFRQFKDMTIICLIIAAIVSFAVKISTTGEISSRF